jgi:RNA recognition motif-containing protein
MSVRLYIGNLPKDLERKELEQLFAAEVGDLGSTKLVTDRKTGKCRGFGFVTVETNELADQVIEKFNGHVFKDSALKIEVATPRAKEEGDDNSAESGPVAASANRRNRNNSAKSNNGRRQGAQTFSSATSQEFQPDPRWASDLERLKAMLMAQTTNS